MPLLMFQNASNLISIIASVSLRDTRAITSLAKLTALITHWEFLLFGPLAAFLLIQGWCSRKGEHLLKSPGAAVPGLLSQQEFGVTPELGRSPSHSGRAS